jgi:hypothetical protein
MRTVTLEFLRHGPPHNQLLSPLTRYMVLCGNHQAADVSVTFEHAQFLTKLRAFQYRETDVNREMQIAETASQMSSILASVPGLVAELADSASPSGNGLTHLRLILSANELALLPFELSNAGSAFPGAGQSLALQPHVPICITREVRRVSSPYLEWPSIPRVLFAASSAGGAIPLDAHMLALRKAIDPWLFHFDVDDDEVRRRVIEEHIKVLPNASVQALVTECASGSYTHIHLLAHGVEREHEYGRRYGLALHDSLDPSAVDFVEGSRLAALLRPSLRTRSADLARPAVVTIAACDSGGVGSVVGAGASIAHALHEAGIPLVIASQFPLSFAGSIVMTEVLYEGLLEGGDPRALLVRLRRELVARVPKTHDWASVVAYASFPQDLDRQLARVRIKQAGRRIEAALNHADFVTKMISPQYQKEATDADGMVDAPVVQTQPASPEASLERLRDAIKRMEDVLPDPDAAADPRKGSRRTDRMDDSGPDPSLVYGLLASAEKRQSEVFWRLAQRPEAGRTRGPNPHYGGRALDALRRSLAHYRNCFAMDRSEGWALVQSMVLTAVLEGGGSIQRDEWELSRLLSQQDMNGEDRLRRAWAHSNLLELELLKPFTRWAADIVPPDSAAITGHIRAIIREVGVNTTEVHSTRRQLLRYSEFFAPIAAHAGRLAKRSPELQRQDHAAWAEAEGAAIAGFEMLPEVTKFD